MADPLSAVFVLASLATVTRNMAQMTRFLFKTQDLKAWTIGIRLPVEQARTEEWARRMGVNSDADIERLRTQLPSESARVIVVTIWQGLRVWTEKATKMFESYARTPKGWATGYPDLLELVDTLTALNDGLEKIVPPPPGYQVHAMSAPSIASADGDVGFNFEEELVNSRAYTLWQMPILSQNATSLISSLPAAQLPHPLVLKVQEPPASQQLIPLNVLEAPSKATSFHPTIEMLFSTCQKSLQLVISQTHLASFRSIARE